jgi:hypothetical protein
LAPFLPASDFLISSPIQLSVMPHCSKTTFAALALFWVLGAASPAEAQINININPPSWGPPAPAGTQYYYVPEYGGYYDLRDQQYIVQRQGKWTRVRTLSGYNPANFHPVVVNYVGATPWVRVEEHRSRYGHPHGMPPGQAKKMRRAAPAPASSGVIINVPGGLGGDVYEDGRGRGNGKHGGGHPGRGHGKGKH